MAQNCRGRGTIKILKSFNNDQPALARVVDNDLCASQLEGFLGCQKGLNMDYNMIGTVLQIAIT